jgi:pyruvate carboxylase
MYHSTKTDATPSSKNITKLAWMIRQEVGYPTVLINSIGGTGSSKPILDESESAIRATCDTNNCRAARCFGSRSSFRTMARQKITGTS